MVEINVNSICMPGLFDKVNITVPSVVSSDGNNAHSGEYLITGICHELNKGDVYKKKVFLQRNGVNKSKII